MSDHISRASPVARWRRVRRHAPEGVNPAEALILRDGDLRDYDALAPFHYRAARPATVVRILTLRESAAARPAAILILSMPTLNGAWRRDAFPALAGLLHDKPAAARWINTNLRTISRVIVEPRWRSLGLARRLVRAYLRHPLTPCTESIAAMGPYCPFFIAAGMRAIPCPVARAERRLARALTLLRISSDQLILAPRTRELARAIRRWARASRRTTHLAHAPLHRLIPLAQSALLARPIAFAHIAPRAPREMHA